MVSLENTENLNDTEEDQLDCLNSCYVVEKHYFESIESDKSNPYSIINLLNRPNILQASPEKVTVEPPDIKKDQENKTKRSKKYSLYSDISFKPGNTPIYDQDLSLEQFIKYLNFKINGDKNHVITKDTLSVFYNQIQRIMNLGPLTRSEKRSKIKVFMKLHKYSKDVMFFLENKPHFFLDPTLLHIKLKSNKRKKYRFRAGQTDQINNL